MLRAETLRASRPQGLTKIPEGAVPSGVGAIIGSHALLERTHPRKLDLIERVVIPTPVFTVGLEHFERRRKQ